MEGLVGLLIGVVIGVIVFPCVTLIAWYLAMKMLGIHACPGHAGACAKQ